MVYTSDLKSDARWACGFESHRSHHFARVAQLVEYFHGKEKVISSILIAGSIFDILLTANRLPLGDPRLYLESKENFSWDIAQKSFLLSPKR